MIAEQIRELHSLMPEGTELVAVSKFHPTSSIREAYAAGQRIFGESRVQELSQKHEELADLNIEWHFIGHLQTNKVKYIVPYVSLIHAIDSPHLLAEVSRQALRIGRRINCLLQLHVAAEETKFGFTPDEAMDFLESGEWREMNGVRLAGIMCMATNTDDEERIRSDFHTARTLFDEARKRFFMDDEGFRHLSMGMSDDWPIAVSEGSTLVRIGTRIFGERNYASS